MRALAILPLVMMVPWTVGHVESSAPECAVRCWENTKYVSKCKGDIACLCSELEYQNSVYQCIYSQCDTAHFGSALHHAISQCLGTGNQILFAAPPTPNRDSLRRREAEYAAGGIKIRSFDPNNFATESANGHPTQSANGFPIASVVGYLPYPTKSVAYPTQSVPYPAESVPYMLSPTSSVVPFFTLNTAPAVTSHSTPVYNALPQTTTAGTPQVFQGLSRSLMPTLSLALLVISMTILFNA